VISIFVSERAISRGLGFVFGFLLFGQPLISYSMKELDRNIPDWKSKLVLELYVQSHITRLKQRR